MLYKMLAILIYKYFFLKIQLIYYMIYMII